MTDSVPSDAVTCGSDDRLRLRTQLLLVVLAFAVSACVRVEVGPGGSVSVEPPGEACSASIPAAPESFASECHAYPLAGSVVVEAIPDEGNQFLGWLEGPVHCAGRAVCEVDAGTRPLLRAAFGPAPPGYVPDSIHLAEDGVLYLHSIEYDRIFRWSIPEGRSLDSIPLAPESHVVAWSPAQRMLYVGYRNGDITRIDPAATSSEEYFATHTLPATALVAAGEYLVGVYDPFAAGPEESGASAPDPADTPAASGVAIGGGPRASFVSFDAAGTVVDWRYVEDPRPDTTWNPEDRRFYWVAEDRVHAVAFDPGSGELVGHVGSADPRLTAASGPVAVSRDGARLVLGSGDVHDARSRSRIYSVPRQFVDVAWGEDGFVGVSESAGGETLVELWGDDRRVDDMRLLPGFPLRIVRRDDSFAVVTLIGGHPTVHEYLPSDDADGDGVGNRDDDFPLDPAASIDRDGDGHPDRWNPGYTLAGSAAGLRRDAFPNDSACSELSDGRWEWLGWFRFERSCDIERTIPNYVPDQVLSDGALLYLLSGEHRRIDRWSPGERRYRNPILLGDGATAMTGSAERGRIYVGYANGAITRVAEESPAREAPFAAMPSSVQALVEAGSWLVGVDRTVRSWPNDLLHSFGPDGLERSSSELYFTGWGYRWEPGRERIYFMNDWGLNFLQVDAETGGIEKQEDVRRMSSVEVDGSVRLSPDGVAMFVAPRQFVILERFSQDVYLDEPLLDIAYRRDGYVALATDAAGQAYVEQRDLEDRVFASASFPDEPIRAVSWDGGEIIVTLDAGRVAFHEFVGNDDVDEDGALNWEDAFMLDPSASLDSDGDGYPDAWNEGRGASDSTLGLAIDASPYDSYCWLGEHLRDGVCDAARKVPKYTPDAVEVDARGVVHLLHRNSNALYRWSMTDEYHLDPIPVEGDVSHMTYSEAADRIYLGYRSGEIRTLDPGSGIDEGAFALLGDSVLGLEAAGAWLFAVDDQYDRNLYTFGPDGEAASVGSTRRGDYGFTWNAASNRVYYFEGPSYAANLIALEVDPATGEIGDPLELPIGHLYPARPPARVSADGDRVLVGTGDLYDGSDLTYRDTIPVYAEDAVWLEDGSLITIAAVPGSSTELRHWNDELEVVDTITFDGRPLRVLGWNGRFVVITHVDWEVTFHIYDPERDSDADGIRNRNDAFPYDPAASTDGDGDGAPDAWNPGAGPDDSTTGLILDAFPDDYTCSIPEHALPGAPSVCEVGSGIPAYEPAEIVLGDDDVLYLLSPEHRRVFRWSFAEQRHLEPIGIAQNSVAIAYSAVDQRLYIGYGHGAIGRVDLSVDPREVPFSTTGGLLQDLEVAGRWIIASGWRSHTVFLPEGDPDRLVRLSGLSAELAWNPIGERIYYLSGKQEIDSLYVEDFNLDTGAITGRERIWTSTNLDFTTPPLRISQDGRRILLGSGVVVDLLTYEVSKPFSFDPVDVYWPPFGLLTIRDDGSGRTRLEHWRRDLSQLYKDELFEGAPLGVVRWSGGIAVVTLLDGVPTVHHYTP